MRIRKNPSFDIETNALLGCDSEEEYFGPIEWLGGGPSQAEKNAQQSQANLTNQLAGAANRQEQFAEAQQAKVNPFFTQRMNEGLPYYNNLVDQTSGTTAQAFAPARAQMMRQLGSQQGLPNGFREGAINDFNENQAQAFDQGLVGAQAAQEQAKQGGAFGLLGQQQAANPMAYYQGALGGNSSIMQYGPGMRGPNGWGILGGAASGLASSIPF